MLPINSANIECVGNGPTKIVATQYLYLGRPPNPKKFERKSIAWEYFIEVEGGDPKDHKSKCNY